MSNAKIEPKTLPGFMELLPNDQIRFNEIKEKIYSFENTDTDIVITEVGGTVGDIEGLSIIEAIRQVGLEKNPEDVVYIHVTLLPYIFGSNEIKNDVYASIAKSINVICIGINGKAVFVNTFLQISICNQAACILSKRLVFFLPINRQAHRSRVSHNIQPDSCSDEQNPRSCPRPCKLCRFPPFGRYPYGRIIRPDRFRPPNRRR